jgi:hypothetical protein
MQAGPFAKNRDCTALPLIEQPEKAHKEGKAQN